MAEGVERHVADDGAVRGRVASGLRDDGALDQLIAGVRAIVPDHELVGCHGSDARAHPLPISCPTASIRVALWMSLLHARMAVARWCSKAGSTRARIDRRRIRMASCSQGIEPPDRRVAPVRRGRERNREFARSNKGQILAPHNFRCDCRHLIRAHRVAPSSCRRAAGGAGDRQRRLPARRRRCATRPTMRARSPTRCGASASRSSRARPRHPRDAGQGRAVRAAAGRRAGGARLLCRPRRVRSTASTT